MEKQNYVVIYNELEPNRQEEPWENIQGTGPLDAVRRRFGGGYVRVKGNTIGYARIAVIRGTYDAASDTIHLKGKYRQYYYG